MQESESQFGGDLHTPPKQLFGDIFIPVVDDVAAITVVVVAIVLVPERLVKIAVLLRKEVLIVINADVVVVVEVFVDEHVSQL